MRVLLVEDNERLAGAVAQHLKGAGFAVSMSRPRRRGRGRPGHRPL